MMSRLLCILLLGVIYVSTYTSEAKSMNKDLLRFVRLFEDIEFEDREDKKEDRSLAGKGAGLCYSCYYGSYLQYAMLVGLLGQLDVPYDANCRNVTNGTNVTPCDGNCLVLELEDNAIQRTCLDTDRSFMCDVSVDDINAAMTGVSIEVTSLNCCAEDYCNSGSGTGSTTTPLPTSTTDCTNSYGGPGCDTWATEGRCLDNRTWMSKNCKKACNMCGASSAAYMELANPPGCGDASIETAEECGEAAVSLGYGLGYKGSVRSGSWRNFPLGCFVGHTTDGRSYTRFNTRHGFVQLEAGSWKKYRSICTNPNGGL